MKRGLTHGGPAFPHQKDDGTPYWGMSLRDWFAGQALPSIIIATSKGKHDPSAKHGCGVEQAMALDAYLIADAMIAAREAE